MRQIARNKTFSTMFIARGPQPMTHAPNFVHGCVDWKLRVWLVLVSSGCTSYLYTITLLARIEGFLRTLQVALIHFIKQILHEDRAAPHQLNTVQTPTIIYEDNAACVAQVHPKFFYAHELQKMNKVRILQTKSYENLADLFAKSLPASSFERCIRGIG